MMWTWASETEWTRLECPEKALYTDVTLKNYGNAMALRFSVYKTEVISHLESGEALCIWAGQRTIARVWRVVQEGKGEKEVHTTGCYIVSLNGVLPGPSFLPLTLCYQHTRPSLSAGSRPRPSSLPSLTATAWEDEGCTSAFSLRCFCSQLTCPMLSAWERRSTMARSGPASPPWTTWTTEGEADPAGSHISERALSRAVALCCLGGTLPPPPCRSPSVSSDPCTAPRPPPVAGCAGESPAVTEGGVYATFPLHRCLSSGLLAPRRSLATSQFFPFPVLIPRLRNATLKCFL
ncbi:uncharacterized protein LOC115942586 isoform X2 [Leptonychotes weddellii]|uniref:Uncharacterized protein LOC115942586 isoform X2 n=1 Tax=Leptonychotes weddellii TaxID=9713 RepID=A0A7F8R7F8_LEPWE|nr:uncharacterized protein LOC115942586 isoform X2 [Leptonychotes weddellii]